MGKPAIRLISLKSQLNSQTPNKPAPCAAVPQSHRTGPALQSSTWCDIQPGRPSWWTRTAGSELNLLPAFLPHQFPLPGSHIDFKLFNIWDLPRPLLKAECVTVWIQFPDIVCFFYRKMSLHCPDLSSAQGFSSRTAAVTGDRDFFTQDLPAGSQTNDHSFTLGDQAHMVQSGKELLWMVMAPPGPKKKSHMKKGFPKNLSG